MNMQVKVFSLVIIGVERRHKQAYKVFVRDLSRKWSTDNANNNPHANADLKGKHNPLYCHAVNTHDGMRATSTPNEICQLVCES